mgnify:CR=1 FL=1
MKKRYDFVVRYLKKLIDDILNWIEKERYSICFLIGVFIVIITAVSDLNMYKKIILLIFISFLYYIGFIFCIGEKVIERELPKLSKRITYKDNEGNISIDKENLLLGIEYLYEIENYIEKQGE